MSSKEAFKIKIGDVELSVTGNFSHGNPGCRYTKNGDGWPPEGDEFEPETVEYKGVDITNVIEALNEGNIWEKIITVCLEKTGEHFQDKYEDAMDDKYHALKDDGKI